MAQFIFEFTEKMILAFEWDLRDIDGATMRNSFSRFCNAIVFFPIYFCQSMLKNEISIISIHKILSTISFKIFSGSFSRYCNEFVR